MALYFIKFLYSTFLFPPGILIIALLGMCFWAWRRDRKIGKVLLIFTAIFYLCTISLVGDSLIRSLESKHTPPTEVQGDVIVMFGGGATLDTPNLHGQGHLSGFAANRLLTTAQLYQLLKVPVIVSGGRELETTGCEAEIAKVILKDLGVPEDKIILDTKSLNTTDNAKYTAQLIEQYNFKKPILVTSAFHMERSLLQCKKAQLEVTPYPTDYQANISAKIKFHELWPSPSALSNVGIALKEYLGILAIRWY